MPTPGKLAKAAEAGEEDRMNDIKSRRMINSHVEQVGKRIVRIDFTDTDEEPPVTITTADGAVLTVPPHAPPLAKVWARELECVSDPETERKLATALRQLRRTAAPRIRRTTIRSTRMRRAPRAHRRTRRIAARRAAAAGGDSGDGPPPRRPQGGRDALLRAALDLAERGGRVLPLWWLERDGRCACHRARCRPGKHPLPYRGHLEATSDTRTIDRWWSDRPRANLGLALAASDLIAIDLDFYCDGERARLAALEAKLGRLPRRTWHQLSGSGDGEHLVFRAPALKPGQTIRGALGGIKVVHHGYIVVSPSGHESGKCYRWALGRAPGDIAVASLPPKWQAALIREDRGESGDLTCWRVTIGGPLSRTEQQLLIEELCPLLVRGARVAEHGGNSRWHVCVRIFHDWGLSISEGWRFLLLWNRQRRNPFSEYELRRQLRRIATRKAAAAGRGWKRMRVESHDRRVSFLGAQP